MELCVQMGGAVGTALERVGWVEVAIIIHQSWPFTTCDHAWPYLLLIIDNNIILDIKEDSPSIALDIGCAVGRSTFELSQKFNQVVGIDYSQAFIDCCNKMKTFGKLPYSITTEGSLVSQHVAEVNPDIVSVVMERILEVVDWIILIL